MYRLVLLFLCYIACVHTVWAQHFIIDSSTPRIELANKLHLGTFPDNTQLSHIKKQTHWHPLTQKYLQPNEAIWAKATLIYDDDITSRFTLVVDNPKLDYVDIFVLDEKGRIIESALMGAKRPFKNRPIPFRKFPLSFNLQPNDKIELYIRIQDDGPSVFPMTLWNNKELIASEQANLTFIGVFGGALIILACYFLVTYLLLKSPVRFWYAVFNFAAFFLFLNIEGLLGQITQFTQYITPLTTILLACVLFSAGKVSHSLLHGVPLFLRVLTYVSTGALILSAPFATAYMQVLLSMIITSGVVAIHLSMAFFYYNPYDNLPNRIYSLAWISISLIVIPHIYLFSQGEMLSNTGSLSLDVMLMFSILMIGVAIEAHENVIIWGKQEEQSNTISDLRRFYSFFKSSAEGLFTAHYDGKMISVNPAMCALFGFNDEKRFLEEADNLDKLIVDPHDLDNIMQQLATENTAIGKEIRATKHDHSEFWISVSVAAQEDNGQRILFGSVVDITERKQNHISLAYLATHDPLTGIYNRRHFEHELTEAMRRAQHDNDPMSLLYLDLDQFKAVNDTCGHKAGDILLKELCQKLDNQIQGIGTLGRMGGDEFAVLVLKHSQKRVQQLAEALLSAVQMHRFVWEDRVFAIGASIGIIHYDQDIANPEQMMSMADSACYIAKERGRGQIHCYSNQDTHIQRYEMELNWLSHINDALDTGNFVLYFQEYRSLKSVAEKYHYELLVRIQEHDGNITLPSSFLPAAERYKLVSKIDKWVIEHYFSWLAQNPEHLPHLGQCNINLSGQSLANPELQLFIQQAFEKYRVPYHKICFEITESMAIIKLEETLKFMETFHQLGCRFALDDFGVGFSSYEYLKKLPVDVVKIDGSFVKNLLKDPIDKAMVRSMHDVAAAMDMKTVAEYVEDKQIMVELGKIGIDYAQGYCISTPRPLKELSVQFET